jgi:hypothetical protein
MHAQPSAIETVLPGHQEVVATQLGGIAEPLQDFAGRLGCKFIMHLSVMAVRSQDLA